MKNYVRLVLISGVFVAAGFVGGALAQPTPGKPGGSLSRAQMSALVTTDLGVCNSKVPVVPADAVRKFPIERISKTLHGVWRGRVRGDYPKELLAQDGFLNVDYYWVVDTRSGETLIIEQLSPKRATTKAVAANAPAWSFLTCGRENYVPKHPRQVHEFQKVSDNIEDARAMLQVSTGLKVASDQKLSLSSAWKQLVETKYFDTKRFGAFAGGLFKPLEIRETTNAAGSALVSLSYRAEYRGAGDTAAQFQAGVPILGKESASFVGVSTPSGDFLVSSAGNGVAWEKADAEGALINMTMDKVVIGPLAR